MRNMRKMCKKNVVQKNDVCGGVYCHRNGEQGTYAVTLTKHFSTGTRNTRRM